MPQIKLKVLVLILFVGAIGLLSLALILDIRPPQIILTLSGPLLKGTSFLGNTFREGFEQYVYLVRVKRENQTLRKENEELKTLLARLREENRLCTRLKVFEEEKLFRKYPRVLARVIYNPLEAFGGYLIIDRGEKDGLRPEMPVVSVAGQEVGVLVGQVVEVAAHYARVLPVTSPESAVEVYSLRSEERGILKGQGLGRLLLLDYVPYGADIREGDLLLTSGADALYPPGIRVGRVHKIWPEKRQGFFQTIKVKPFVEIKKLRYVMVLITTRGFRP